MAVAIPMAQTSTSHPDLWKPRYAARQHQEQPQQHQHLPRSRSLREPFDAAELTRKLENYRQELKLDKARRERAQKKAERTDSANSTVPQSEASTLVDKQTSSGVQRSRSTHLSNNLTVNQEPERKRSLIGRKPKHEAKEESAEAAGPYMPRVAARQFTATTTPLKKKKEEQAQQHLHAEVKSRDTSNKHKLDWSEPASFVKPPSPSFPPAQEIPDAETTQKRIQAMHAFQQTSKARPRPLSTALENMRVWDADSSNVYSSVSPKLPEEPQQPQSDFVPPAYRPGLKHGDRHDWSQASQCGDSARQSLHLFRRKDAMSEDAEMAGLRAAAKSKPRQKSHGEASDHLVSDAVKLIKEERRKSGILHIFRRH